MLDNLKIDIIVPLFNKKNHIERCLDSVLNQKIKFNKILIINDGSTDQVEDIILSYSLNNKNIEVINQANKGVSNARNTGIKNSNADYIVFLDADDELNEFYLHEIYRLIRFNKNKNVKIFSTRHKNLFNDVNIKNKYIEKKSSFKFSKNPILNITFDKTILCASGLCLSKKILHDKLFPENIKIGEDIYVWEKILLNESLAWSDQELINIYKNAENRAQNINNEIPYYILKYNELVKFASSFKKKLYLSLFHLLSLFIIINQFKIKKILNNKNFEKIYVNQNKIFKILAIIFRNHFSFLIYLILSFIKKIFNELSLFPVIIYLLITPTAPLIFLIIFLKDLKVESSLFLIYSSITSLFIFLLTFQNRIYLSKSFPKFSLNYIIIYRFFSSLLIFIFFSLIFYLFINLQNYNLFIFCLSTMLIFWIAEIVLLRFEKFGNKRVFDVPWYKE